ncbi:hypothetical protein GCM10011613_32160 [Cellvibrio zantedeschiae]|uniref:DUF2934 domain-containing protein n=1 Tax=Cellvibrio zantedeschiae TaxID=1237077 RepID=A0ABQ3B8R7_9GAMM|nr:DUF2934 domain-containing protein [Cellvibrio zantedeschiae]GGY84712.1 hypothetical protein GCM10011613_32160 [Cellvibrio zantedeschiae]
MVHTEHNVRSLAHQIWESEGKPSGQAERHWHLAARLMAEAEHKNHPHQKRSVDPSEATGPTEPEQPDQT